MYRRREVRYEQQPWLTGSQQPSVGHSGMQVCLGYQAHPQPSLPRPENPMTNVTGDDKFLAPGVHLKQVPNGSRFVGRFQHILPSSDNGSGDASRQAVPLLFKETSASVIGGSPVSPMKPRSSSAIHDYAIMENVTLGDWRRTVAHFRMMENQGDSPPMGDDPKSLQEDSDEASMVDVEHNFRKFLQIDPALYDWLASRMGTPTKVLLIVSFMLLEGGRAVLAERAYVQGINLFAMIVVTNLTSLLLAVWLSLVLEGATFMKKMSHCHYVLRFLGISFLFTFASVLVLCAYRIGTPPIEVVTIGYIYMPISAVLSYYVFRRRYGLLEWLSVGMMSLAVLAFIYLREESKGDAPGRAFLVEGFCLVVFAVAVSVSASILAERAFKEQSLCVTQRAKPQQTRFYIMKVHLDFAALLCSVFLWAAHRVLPQSFDDFFLQWSHTKAWFGTWGADQFKMIFVAVAHGWAAGLITKEFSTVIKAIVQTVSVVLVMCLSDKLMGNRFNFGAREIPSLLLTLILLMSAVIFQTGRINLKVVRRAANIDAEAHPVLGMEALAEPEGGPSNPSSDKGGRRTFTEAELEKHIQEVGSSPVLSPSLPKMDLFNSWRTLVTMYALILVYIVFDASRTIVLQKSLQSSAINSVSMGIVCYMVGVTVATAMTFNSHGFHGVARAWNPRGIIRCLPASFLFALSTALGNMSFAQGINSALYVVLGKVYTPVAAMGDRCINNKYYMWLEWFALLILTMASVVFGYLQAYDVTSGKDASVAPIAAMLLVLASASVSALASLATERILKDDENPFHLTKVHLDAGGIISSLCLLPVIGLIATRAQDIPWAERPLDTNSCPSGNVCWNLDDGGCSNPACQCDCTSGVFAGWNNPVLILAVCINTVQGWLVGRVTQKFSVIHRAVADSFSLLALYFIGDPIFNHTSLANTALNLIAFIVPLATATFSAASSQMQKVLSANKRLTGRKKQFTEHEKWSGSDSGSDSSVLSAGGLFMRRLSTDDSPLGTMSSGSGIAPRDSESPNSARFYGAGYYRSASEGAWME